MKKDCEKCKGEGGTECECCHRFTECDECGGLGWAEVCISIFDIPKDWKRAEELREIQVDAGNCISDHAKLCSMNPAAKKSYDWQLELTLRNLNAKATTLEP